MPSSPHLPTEVDAIARSLEQLRGTLSGGLLTATDPDYHRARAVWNAMIDHHPLAIVPCHSVGDVIAVVQCAGLHALPVSVRAGGHNVAGHGVGDGSMMIDLSPLRTVNVDAASRTASVQGGARWADVDAATQACGLVTPGGLVSDTGVAGLTLSGGIGWLRSRYGLCIDNLLAVEMVMANGTVLHASERENPDIFWAIRGGGGNFGVVTCFDFSLHPLAGPLMFVAPIYPLSAGAEPIRFWRDFLADKGDDIGSICEFSTIPKSPDYPQEYWGTRCYTLAAVYAGDCDQGAELMQCLREQGPLIADFSGPMEYVELQKLFDKLFPAGEFRCYWKSHLLLNLSDRAIAEALENAANSPSDHSISSLWNFGGASARVAAVATAFGDRSFGWMYSLDSVWRNAEDDAAMIDWTRRAWQRAREHAHQNRLYLNFAGQDADSVALTRDAFGENYKKLAELKRMHDPGNMFRFNQNIPP